MRRRARSKMTNIAPARARRWKRVVAYIAVLSFAALLGQSAVRRRLPSRDDDDDDDDDDAAAPPAPIAATAAHRGFDDSHGATESWEEEEEESERSLSPFYADRSEDDPVGRYDGGASGAEPRMRRVSASPSSPRSADDADVTGRRRTFPRLVHLEDLPYGDVVVARPHPSAERGAKKRRGVKKRGELVDERSRKTRKRIEDDVNYIDVGDRARDWVRGLDNDPSSQGRDVCVPMSTWQTGSYPTCNLLHELDLGGKARVDGARYRGSGYFNDVFRVTDEGRRRGRNRPPPSNGTSAPAASFLALKVLSPGKNPKRAAIPSASRYSEVNYDIVRRDGLVLERLTSSPRVLPLHGYCGFALVVPYAPGGTLGNAIASRKSDPGWRHASSVKAGRPSYGDMPPEAKLHYAVDAASGLADVHDADVVHGDLNANQYLIAADAIGENDEGPTIATSLLLGDFNRGILLRRNTTAEDSASSSNGGDPPTTACTFVRRKNIGKDRSPEEMRSVPQTRAVDVWSLGTILYQILVGDKVWSDYDDDAARDLVAGGRLPEINASMLNGSDPVHGILRGALDMCFTYDPSERASAREVANFLDAGLRELRST